MAMQAPMCDLLAGFQVWSDLDEANPGHVTAADGQRGQHSSNGTRRGTPSGTRQPKLRTENDSNILLRVLLPASKRKTQ